MNDNVETPNPQLRDYATEGAFALTLSKTHMATLVAIANNDQSLAGRNWLGALDGLKRRGLAYHAKDWFGAKMVVHRGMSYPEPKQLWGPYDRMDSPLTNICRLTRAGWLVYDLLAEAGMARAIDRRSALRKRIAA